MDRRTFLKSLAAVGLVAAAPKIVLPTDEQVRRYWRLDGSMLRSEWVEFPTWHASYTPLEKQFIPSTWRGAIIGHIVYTNELLRKDRSLMQAEAASAMRRWDLMLAAAEATAAMPPYPW